MKKQMLKGNKRCTVTFVLPAQAVGEAEEVYLMGDFNDWDRENAITMKRLKNGSYQTKLTLSTGKDYHFRYLLNGEVWENDWEADRYEVSPLYGHIENSVLCLTPEEKEKEG